MRKCHVEVSIAPPSLAQSEQGIWHWQMFLEVKALLQIIAIAPPSLAQSEQGLEAI